MSGGINALQGMYYQITICVKRILTMISKSDIRYIIPETINNEEEDINIFYENGKIIYEQVKTKKIGNWTITEFFNRVFTNFHKVFTQVKIQDNIFFRFTSNAAPDRKLFKLIHEIKHEITESNYTEMFERISNLNHNEKEILRKFESSDTIEILQRFEPNFPYFSSNIPEKPEKYISDFVKHEICLLCGKTYDESNEVLDALLHFAFQKSRYKDKKQRKIHKKDIFNIINVCIPREQRWKENMNKMFPKQISEFIFNEIISGRLYYPKFDLEIPFNNLDCKINMKIYSKTKSFLFKVLSQTLSQEMKNILIKLNKYVRRMENMELICIVDEKLFTYPEEIIVISEDLESLERLKFVLRG